MYNKLRNNHGTILIEIILSLAILSIIIIPLYNTIMTSAKINKEAEDMLVAVNHAGQIIEQRRADIALPERVVGYSYVLREDSALDHYTITDNIYNYNGLLRIEQVDQDDKLVAYKTIDSERIQVGSWLITNPMEVRISVYSNQMIVSMVHDEMTNITIPYTSTGNNQMKIGVETYGSHDITVYVRNELAGDSLVYIYTSQVLVDGVAGTGQVTVHEEHGLVKTRRVSQQVMVNEETTHKLLRKINVKVSDGDTYSEDEKLVEIDTLKKE